MAYIAFLDAITWLQTLTDNFSTSVKFDSNASVLQGIDGIMRSHSLRTGDEFVAMHLYFPELDNRIVLYLS